MARRMITLTRVMWDSIVFNSSAPKPHCHRPSWISGRWCGNRCIHHSLIPVLENRFITVGPDILSETFTNATALFPFPPSLASLMSFLQNSPLICSLNREFEKGVSKGDVYWPQSSSHPLELGHFRISLDSILDMPDHDLTIRYLSILYVRLPRYIH